MSEYQVIDLGVRGKRYKYQGKLIKKSEVPIEVIEAAEGSKPAGGPAAANEKACIFCGAYSNIERLVNMQTVVVCEEHYYDKTVGQIAQEIKKKEKVNA